MLDSLKECASSHSDILILNWYHLIEVNCLSLILDLWLLIFESNLTWSKWLQMVPCTQLVVQYLQFILNLCVIRSGSWICTDFFRDLFHKVSLNRWLKGIRHVEIWNTKRWTYLLKDCLLCVLFWWVVEIFVWGWWLQVSWISVRHDCNISSNQIVSLSICTKLSKITALK